MYLYVPVCMYVCMYKVHSTSYKHGTRYYVLVQGMYVQEELLGTLKQELKQAQAGSSVYKCVAVDPCTMYKVQGTSYVVRTCSRAT